MDFISETDQDSMQNIFTITYKDWVQDEILPSFGILEDDIQFKLINTKHIIMEQAKDMITVSDN